MNEDFGYCGDEFLLGDCRDDWGLDLGPDLEVAADAWEEHQAVLREFADEAREAEAEAEAEAVERKRKRKRKRLSVMTRWMATMKALWLRLDGVLTRIMATLKGRSKMVIGILIVCVVFAALAFGSLAPKSM